MKRVLIFIFIIFSFNYLYADKKGILHTTVVIQNWKMDGTESRIAEGTLPLEIIYPIKDNISLQIIHSPAISSFGDVMLSGLSDTWIKTTYTTSNEKLMISAGAGIPTGKTDITKEEATLSSLLSYNVYKFRLPVFGQGFTANAGVALAQPLGEKFVLGVGLNYIFLAKYKYLGIDFDPGEQIGVNVGFDYNHSESIRLSFDFLYNYYSSDKLNSIEHRVDPQIGIKAKLIYASNNKMLVVKGQFRHKGKSETETGATLVPDSTNSNIKQLELDSYLRLGLTPLLSLDLLFDARSYIENEYGKGQADIFGFGLRNNIQLTPNFLFYFLFKKYMGDAYFNGTIPAFAGFELQVGTTISF